MMCVSVSVYVCVKLLILNFINLFVVYNLVSYVKTEGLAIC